ncbi:MAG: response regulator [Acidobacteria bacterium]|nr:response regulator [Acidobacteriota bacterium]
MPRLLLVDDNPSIHRIAESLLAPTAIELVCVDSAAEALERLQNGERFDVAMIDTAMPGMDGWTLLERLRAMEATARMPIALMAGVLDPVDPVKIQNAPIQGFLKKPIELRELGDRVNALLATPVAPAAGPVTPLDLGPTATRPMTKDDLALAVEEFPEFRPTIQLPDEDLLVLGPEDLWMEEAPVAAAIAPVFEAEPAVPELELEELDLEGLQDLAPAAVASAPIALPAPMPEVPAALAPELAPDLDHELDLDLELTPEPLAPVVPEGLATLESPALPDLDTLGAEELAGFLDEDLPALPEARVDPFHSMAFEPEPVPIHLGDSEAEREPEEAPLAPALEAFEAPVAAPVEALVPVAVPAPAPEPAAATGAPVAPPTADPEALVRAILANPALVEALSKAIAGSLSEKALKEVAWEVIPDLARKLHS